MKKPTALLPLLLLFPQLLLAQMWDELATSPYRLDSADVKSLKVELESLSFFRDNEYSGHLTEGYSLPGLWAQPKLTYMPLRNIKVELGLQALLFSGVNRYPNYVYHDIAKWKGNQYTGGAHLLPWFRAQADFRCLSVVLGDIYGGQNHGLMAPLFNPETNLSQDPEMGLQLLWDRPHLHADIWLNWQSYIFKEDTHQEAFTVGTVWRTLLNAPDSRLHWHLPVQLIAQHRGGEQNVTNRGVETIWNAAVGTGATWHVDRRVIKRCAADVGVLYCYQQTGALWPFKQGVAGYAGAELNLWHRLDVGASYFMAPKHFVSLYGNHFYSTLSTRDNLCYGRQNTAELHVRFHHTFAYGYTLGADAEAFQTWQASKSMLNFSFGVYLRIAPSLLLKRL